MLPFWNGLGGTVLSWFTSFLCSCYQLKLRSGPCPHFVWSGPCPHFVRSHRVQYFLYFCLTSTGSYRMKSVISMKWDIISMLMISSCMSQSLPWPPSHSAWKLLRVKRGTTYWTLGWQNGSEFGVLWSMKNCQFLSWMKLHCPRWTQCIIWGSPRLAQGVDCSCGQDGLYTTVDCVSVMPFPTPTSPAHSDPSPRLLQCILHGAALEDDLEATSGPECGGVCRDEYL